MATPVITSITPASPVTVAAGATVTVTVAGTDADAHSETYGVQLRDAAGHLSSEVPSTFVFADPMEVVVTQPQGSTGVVVLDPVDKSKFTVHNPA